LHNACSITNEIARAHLEGKATEEQLSYVATFQASGYWFSDWFTRDDFDRERGSTFSPPSADPGSDVWGGLYAEQKRYLPDHEERYWRTYKQRRANLTQFLRIYSPEFALTWQEAAEERYNELMRILLSDRPVTVEIVDALEASATKLSQALATLREFIRTQYPAT